MESLLIKENDPVSFSLLYIFFFRLLNNTYHKITKKTGHSISIRHLKMASSLPPSHEHAYCEWVSCEAYLGTKNLTDSDCRSLTDFARLSADLYRQHLLRGKRSGQEVYLRVTPQTIRVRVTGQTEAGGQQPDLDEELDIRNIARCSTGHDPFPQVVVLVTGIGLRGPGGDDCLVGSGNPSRDSWSMDMCCYGIACANACNASRLAKTMSRAFEDSHRPHAQPQPFYFPQTRHRDQRLSRNTVQTMATPVGYTNAVLPTYGAHAMPLTGAHGRGNAQDSSRIMDSKKGLPEVGSW